MSILKKNSNIEDFYKNHKKRLPAFYDISYKNNKIIINISLEIDLSSIKNEEKESLHIKQQVNVDKNKIKNINDLDIIKKDNILNDKKHNDDIFYNDLFD